VARPSVEFQISSVEFKKRFKPEQTGNKSSKFQAPTSRETSITRFPNQRADTKLMFEIWSFSGAWMLEFGACLYLRFLRLLLFDQMAEHSAAERNLQVAA
jgi:hypothetical protein